MEPQTIPQQTISGISGGGELSLYQYFIASPLFAGFNDFSGNDRKLFLVEYAKMSQSLKNYLSSTETASNIAMIGSNYQLEDNQIYRIATTVRELLVGSVFIKDFPITLSSKLGIDDIKAGEIANNIISKSFGPIIEDVKRIQRAKFPDKIAQIQKDSQPSSLTQSSAKPAPTRQFPTPAQAFMQPGSRTSDSGFVAPKRPSEVSLPGTPPSTQPVTRPIEPPRVTQEASPQNRAMNSQPQAMRPPVQQIPQIKPEPQQAIQPELPTPTDVAGRGSSIVNQNLNNYGTIGTQKMSTPVFKVPDLGPTAPTKPGSRASDSGFVASKQGSEVSLPGKQAPLVIKGEGGKSLEEALDKIANVIDLRNQQK